MAHQHRIYDTDHHFNIDPLTRAITTESKKVTLIQGDHNSERFTFQVPRTVEGHDLTLCNRVQIHYINVDQVTKAQSADLYEVDDLGISPDGDDVVIFSWPIHRNATKYAGPLSFVARFECLDGDVVEYAWSTAIYRGITVSDGIHNAELVVEEYADILQQWRDQIFNTANVQVSVLTAAEYEALVAEGAVDNDVLYLLSDDPNVEGISATVEQVAKNTDDIAANEKAIEDRVMKTGDTMTGTLQVPYMIIQHPTNNSPALSLMASGATTPAGGIMLYHHDPEGDLSRRSVCLVAMNKDQDGKEKRCGEYFLLPATSDGLTAPQIYGLLTTKHPVLIDQGGTGANNPKQARENLGVPSVRELTDGTVVPKKASAADSAADAAKVNGMEVKRERDVLKIDGSIVPQRRLLWRGVWNSGEEPGTMVHSADYDLTGCILEVETDRGIFKLRGKVTVVMTARFSKGLDTELNTSPYELTKLETFSAFVPEDSPRELHVSFTGVNHDSIWVRAIYEIIE